LWRASVRRHRGRKRTRGQALQQTHQHAHTHVSHRRTPCSILLVAARVAIAVTMKAPVWIPLQGNSMAPALMDGDLLRLEPVAGRVNTGDVVVLRLARGWAVHRVISRRHTPLVTRGDACVSTDRPGPLKLVLFRVTRVRRGGKLLPVPPSHPSWRLLWRRFIHQLRTTLSQPLAAAQPGSRLRGTPW